LESAQGALVTQSCEMGLVDCCPVGQAAHTVSALVVPSVKILPAVHTVSFEQMAASLLAVKVPLSHAPQPLSAMVVPAVET